MTPPCGIGTDDGPHCHYKDCRGDDAAVLPSLPAAYTIAADVTGSIHTVMLSGRRVFCTATYVTETTYLEYLVCCTESPTRCPGVDE